MSDFSNSRRAFLGISAASSAELASLLACDVRDAAGANMVPVSVAAFGARGNGTTDDTGAFRHALHAGAGDVVLVPSRPAGYRLDGSIELPEETTLLFQNPRQRIVRGGPGDLVRMASGASVVGGVFEGGGHRGACFVLPDGTGQQQLSDIVAEIGWPDPIIRFQGSGGSQSRIGRFRLCCDPVAGRGTSFAIVIDETGSRNACPRHFTDGDFNGRPSFAFGACSVVMIYNCYCADLHFSDRSRGVMMAACRVGNQRTLVVRGSDHILDCGWAPRVTVASGADNCQISGFYNAGYVMDASGSGRNQINYWEHPVLPSIASDDRSLYVADGSDAGIARHGSTYRFRFNIVLPLRELPEQWGNGMIYVPLPEGVSTTSSGDQWSTGSALLADTDGQVHAPVSLRVLPADAVRRAVMVFYRDQPLSRFGLPAGTRLAALSGTAIFGA